jgi:SAM-dependent methyltransferase
MNVSKFQWTPDFWQGWRESANPYRRFKSERDRQLVLDALDVSDQDRILEVGCGYGWISSALWQTAKIEWTGVDRSAEMLGRLGVLHPDRGSRGLQADARLLPFRDGEFDKVLCTGVLMHIREYKVAVRELIRVLRPGGLLVCSINNALSPASVAVRLWNSRKKGFVQHFEFPSAFRNFLRGVGLRVDQMIGDGILATVPIAIGRFSFPPSRACRTVCKCDSWMVDRFVWLGYEVWFRGIKAGLGQAY